jgi:AraC-like DNA-binding protein
MKRARDVEDFVAEPVGRYDIGPTHVVWCHSATLCGTVHWGRPSESDAAELVRRLELTGHPSLASGFDVYMDARAMEAFDWPTFGVVSGYVRTRLGEWARRIRRHAIVVPQGAVGALVAGLLPLLGPEYPLRFFGTVQEALTWLERPELPRLLDEIAEVADVARAVSPLIRLLREHLDKSLQEPTIEAAAKAVSLSPRTLQRELRRMGTQFTHELMRARVRAACTRLEHSDEKIEAIARRVGCGSSSQLSTIFRRYLGETPAEYRARRRSC